MSQIVHFSEQIHHTYLSAFFHSRHRARSIADVRFGHLAIRLPLCCQITWKYVVHEHVMENIIHWICNLKIIWQLSIMTLCSYKVWLFNAEQEAFLIWGT